MIGHYYKLTFRDEKGTITETVTATSSAAAIVAALDMKKGSSAFRTLLDREEFSLTVQRGELVFIGVDPEEPSS